MLFEARNHTYIVVFVEFQLSLLFKCIKDSKWRHRYASFITSIIFCLVYVKGWRSAEYASHITNTAVTTPITILGDKLL